MQVVSSIESVTKTRRAKLWKGESKKATEENDVDSKTNKTTAKHENELPVNKMIER